MNYYYKVFNLKIQSDFLIEGFFTHPDPEAPIDVHFRIGEIPAAFDKAPDSVYGKCEFNQNELLYTVNDQIRIFIRYGRELIVANKSGDWDLVQVKLCNIGIALLLFQRNSIPFHASAVLDSANQLWLFMGFSHSGKSSIALKFLEMGFKIFTDDMIVLEYKNEKFYGISSFPILAIRDQTISSHPMLNQNSTVAIGSEPGRRFFYFHKDFCDRSYPIAGIIHLEKDGEQIEFKKINSLAGLQLLYHNIYALSWVDRMRKNQLIFNHISKIAKKVEFYNAKRPPKQSNLDEFSDRIIKLMQRDCGD
jgi:hypothetical protein